MNRTDQNPDAMLDAIIEQIRADEPDPAVMAAARSRGWERLVAASASAAQPEGIADCAGFQALFPSFRDKTLTPARRMLVEDHLHECVACRKAFHARAGQDSPNVVAMRPRRAWMPSKWAVAAALTVGAGLGSWFTWDNFGPAPSGARARLSAADGGVYRLNGNVFVPVSTGAEFADRDVLRTADGSRATLHLIDGSDVEVGERSELSVSAARKDTTVYLDRGQIIVQAAKRRTGHLYVASADSRVAVTGTVFSVNRGLAGSRVSVVEGEVHVEHANQNNVLHPGDQVTTHPSMARTSVADEIAWSRNYDHYLTLLKQFAALRGKLQEVHLPGLRYGSRLLDYVPEGTDIYVSVPNLGQSIADVQRIVKEQASNSPELQNWLQTQLPQFEKVTSQMTKIGEYIGDEIVFASRSCKGFCGVLIAEVRRPGLREYIEDQTGKLGIGQDPGGMKMVYSGDKLFIGREQDVLDAVQRGGSRFAQSDFGHTITDIYKGGAALFVAANLQHVLPAANSASGSVPASGFDKARHFVAEQKEVNGKTEYSATVTFAGEREGFVSWIAAPGTMGSLNFVSPDAQFAAAFVAKQPAQMLQDLIGLVPQTRSSGFTVDQFEENTGVSAQQLASYLGGDITVAVDGPIIPVPSWKLIVEVRDSAGLQTAIRKIVDTANLSLRTAGRPELQLSQETANGQTWYTLRGAFGQNTLEANYVFADGYLVAAPARSLLERTLRDRAAGATLARSQQFTNLLPQNSRANFSGIVYQNAGELMRLFAEGSAAVAGTTEEQQKRAQELSRSVEPMLVCLYGGKDRIEIASQGSALNLLMQTLARAGVTRISGAPSGANGGNTKPRTTVHLKRWSL